MNDRVLIDTDILIDYFKNNVYAVEYLENENRELIGKYFLFRVTSNALTDVADAARKQMSLYQY